MDIQRSVKISYFYEKHQVYRNYGIPYRVGGMEGWSSSKPWRPWPGGRSEAVLYLTPLDFWTVQGEGSQSRRSTTLSKRRLPWRPWPSGPSEEGPASPGDPPPSAGGAYLGAPGPVDGPRRGQPVQEVHHPQHGLLRHSNQLVLKRRFLT
jgi:hypothetical protein